MIETALPALSLAIPVDQIRYNEQGLVPAIVQDYLDGIMRAARRAKKLVEQVLTFSRSSEQKESLQYLHPVVKDNYYSHDNMYGGPDFLTIQLL